MLQIPYAEVVLKIHVIRSGKSSLDKILDSSFSPKVPSSLKKYRIVSISCILRNY